MAHCGCCKAELPERGSYCPSCGAPVAGGGDLTRSAPGPKVTGTASSLGRTSTPSSTRGTGRFLPGSLLAERYRIVALLGAGGMGEVYRADDLTLGQPVALKFLPESAARDEIALERFRNEVRTARRVSHPNVCRVYDVGEMEGHIFLSMEYVDGEDLASLLRRIGRLPGDKAIEVSRQICAGLSAAHREGVLHRDLKPANIMLDGRGRAVITDFGLADLTERIQGQEARCGTPAYMAPEQLAGKEATSRSDLYSLGLVLFEVFTGKRPFDAPTMAGMLEQRSLAPASRPSIFLKNLDPAVERVIMSCLEPDPASRPASALAVAAALPGGDPLAAALAAGETPSPELVAAAGETEGLAPRTAIACFGAFILGLVLLFSIGIQENGLAKIPLPNSPEVLEAKARDIVAQLGYSPDAADHAAELFYDEPHLDYLNRETKTRAEWDRILKERPSLLNVWYRQSPEPLIPHGYWNSSFTPGHVGFSDPAPTVSGMIHLRLDPQGKLLYFEAIPPQMEKESEAETPDWKPIFTAAGIDQIPLQSATPTWNSLASADTRAAWTGSWPGSGLPLRVEAAAWRGKPVFFSLIGPWTKPDRMPEPGETGTIKFLNVFSVLLLFGILGMGGFLAYRNCRKGRGDRQGAFRLAAAMFVLEIVIFLFRTHVVASGNLLFLVILAVATGLLVSGIIWVFYLAVEPYIRRHWPQTIISWSRTIAGRWRDPLVGRDILFGSLLGMAWSLVFVIGYLFQISAGARPQFPTEDFLMGGRAAVANVLYQVLGSALSTLIFLVLLVFLRSVLKNRWVAALVFVVIFAAPNIIRSNHPLLEGPVWLIIYGIASVAVVRFGLIVLAVALFSASVLLNIPYSLDFSRWYTPTSLLVIAPFLALAAWGFYSSLGGEKLLKGELFE